VTSSGRRRVAVVTGGAAGIGAAIAEGLGRAGAYVVTMDPVVSLDGSTRLEAAAGSVAEASTAQRITDAGGAARASSVSVTDELGVRELFLSLVDEFGALDVVVNVAGISRPTSFAAGKEDDWAAVLAVHLNGYLNVLGAALPIMAEAGHGQILGVTSGSGWRAANTGAYGCAKRAVAALTWQLGAAAPPGVTVNALSPIAATRMVTGALSKPASGGGKAGDAAATGGLNLGSMPQPEMLGPVGAYLASEQLAWCNGQVIFSSGSEVAWLAPPRPIEVVQTTDLASLPAALETLVPQAFGPAEAAQATNGGSNPRFGPVFAESAVAHAVVRSPARCLLVTDDAEWGAVMESALSPLGVACVGLGAWPAGGDVVTSIPRDFAAASEAVAAVAQEHGPLDVVVLALLDNGGGATAADSTWQQILASHADIAADIRTDAGWVRAVADYSTAAARPVRVVTVTAAAAAGGWSRGQASAQLSRAGRLVTTTQVEAFAVSLESDDSRARQPAADLVAYLATGPDAGRLVGAELVAADGWLGLRSHPCPAGSISFAGPEIPNWLDGTLRTIVTGGALAH
jgi:NAD(P)-dependent dehydrogenase (short-subunit alcohol dehydrogenase family)